MRVLYFSDNSSDHNRRFLVKLAFFGHEVWFLDIACTTVPEGWLPPGVRWVSHQGVIRRGSDPSIYETFLPEFQSVVARLQPDLVHAGPVQGCGYVASLSSFHPLVVASWGSDLLLDAARNAAWMRATAVALNGADGFMCDADAVRKAAQGFASIPDSRIAQFPWGIERGSFSPTGRIAANASLSSEPEAIRFICTRSWESMYAIDVLLDAFRQAHDRNGLLRLILLGEGSLAGMVRDFISQHRLDKAVLAPGRISSTELPGWFRAATAYVSCARSDGTSVSLLEAMATGLPVVVTDIPSNREWVSLGKNGWLAADGSAEDFAGKMLQVARLKPSERQAMGEWSQKAVGERADWDRNFPRLLDLYESLVKVKMVTQA